MINLESYNVGAQITKIINQDLISTEKSKMKESLNYYKGQHEILNYRMFYVDSNGVVKEERNRSNEKLVHRFHTQIIDQKVGYILSNPVQFKTENEELEGFLTQYIDADLQQTLFDLVEGASLKGWEGIYYYYDRLGKIHFEVVDSYNLIPLTDSNGELKQIIRHYNVTVNENGEQKIIHKAEVFDDEAVYYFVKDNSGYKLDDSVEMNPRFHKMLKIGGELYKAKDLQLPFLILDNNRMRSTDLEPIKSLIDDYDLHASALTNNLVDFDSPVYMVKNYSGDNLDDLITNLKTRKTVGVDNDGDLKVQTIDIPFEARKEKLSITRKAIYEFSMSYDSSSVGSEGHQLTNVGIKAMYSLLDIKANKIETRLRKLLKQVLLLILQNIKDLTNKSFDLTEIEVIITRSAMTNDKEKAEEENLLAQAQLTRVNAILNAGMQLDKSLTAELLAKELGLDVDKVTDFITSEDYIEPLTGE